MTVQTKAQLLRLVASLERQNKKLRKRIAEFDARPTYGEIYSGKDDPKAHVTPLPVNVFPWDEQS